MTDHHAFSTELKFVIPQAAAATVRQWARHELAADPNGVETGGDGYRTTTLYFDTEDLALYFRRGSYGRAKFRIRAYNGGAAVFLERKMKAAGRVFKRRSRVSVEDLERLTDPRAEWQGRWFARRIDHRYLKPVCQIAYTRTARIGASVSGPVRVTIDERLSAVAIDSIAFTNQPGVEVLPGQAILELKYRVEPPPLFQRLIEEFQLEPRAMSKYRLSVQKLGLVDEGAATAVRA